MTDPGAPGATHIPEDISMSPSQCDEPRDTRSIKGESEILEYGRGSTCLCAATMSVRCNGICRGKNG